MTAPATTSTRHKKAWLLATLLAVVGTVLCYTNGWEMYRSLVYEDGYELIEILDPSEKHGYPTTFNTGAPSPSWCFSRPAYVKKYRLLPGPLVDYEAFDTCGWCFHGQHAGCKGVILSTRNFWPKLEKRGPDALFLGRSSQWVHDNSHIACTCAHTSHEEA